MGSSSWEQDSRLLVLWSCQALVYRPMVRSPCLRLLWELRAIVFALLWAGVCVLESCVWPGGGLGDMRTLRRLMDDG